MEIVKMIHDFTTQDLTASSISDTLSSTSELPLLGRLKTPDTLLLTFTKKTKLISTYSYYKTLYMEK